MRRQSKCSMESIINNSSLYTTPTRVQKYTHPDLTELGVGEAHTPQRHDTVHQEADHHSILPSINVYQYIRHHLLLRRVRVVHLFTQQRAARTCAKTKSDTSTDGISIYHYQTFLGSTTCWLPSILCFCQSLRYLHILGDPRTYTKKASITSPLWLLPFCDWIQHSHTVRSPDFA